MAKTVVGLYDTEELARRAADELKQHGFDDLPIHVETQEKSTFTRDRGSDLTHTLQEVGVPQDEAQFYSEGVQRGGGLLIVEAPDERADSAARLMNEHEPIQRERGTSPRERGTSETRTSETRTSESRRKASGEEEEAHLTEAREEMHVGKRKTSGGGVRIHKRVKERPVEETVNLREEEVDVDRQPASETTDDPEDAFKEETVEMSETREEPVVEKETHVEDEVVARKRSRERSETVHDTVRETEIDVEEVGEEFGKHREGFREHYDTAFGDADRGYDEYEPAYRFGYAYGRHKDYSGRNYNQVEPELRRHYERRHGDGTFEQVRDAVRHAYNRGRG